MVTHTDKRHLHNHFAINSVNAETGLKWEQTAKDLYALKEYSNRLCREHGLAEIAFGTNKQNQSYGEWQNRRDGTSWKAALEADIRDCLSYCTSKAAFFHAMNDKGIDVTWTKDRKYVTFKLPDGKKCRNSKLSDSAYFSKENMQSIINGNRENMEIFEAIPDLWLDSLRLAGSMLNPSEPDYLLQNITHRDLSDLEGKALLEAIEKLKNDYEAEVKRIKAAMERQQADQQSARAFGALVDTLELLFDEDDIEIG